jgi:methylenetetrahydrofolate reductase (NADPH)
MDVENQLTAMPRFVDALASGRFVVTAEVNPPAAVDGRVLLERARPLKGLVDAVNVTDGASARASMSALAAAAILQRDGVETILQLTCRDRNRLALQADILGAAALGIRNLLLLTGDDPSAGDQPDAKPVFDLTSASLMATAAAIRDRGELPSGRAIDGTADLCLGSADVPVDPDPAWRPAKLKEKIEAGSQFAQTQFCMDVGVVRRYAARLADEGLLDRIRLLIGVAPIASARSARWMRDNLFGTIISDAIVDRLERADDARAEGGAICVEFLHALTEVPGIAGAHIMAPLNEAAIAEVVTAFRGG